MFTGLVERVGRIVEIEEIGCADGEAARRFVIDCGDSDNSKYLEDAVLGESISVNGVCLTATSLEGSRFTVDAIEETLRRTTLGQKKVGDKVNLERALKANARLGGHIVQGHVDGVGIVSNVRDEGASWWVTFEPPSELLRYIVGKGSICIDGISLTVANVAYTKFSVALIPHTREVTAAGEWREGASVNLETDVLAKYVERLTQWNQDPHAV
jgi:riboflavin synthase